MEKGVSSATTTLPSTFYQLQNSHHLADRNFLIFDLVFGNLKFLCQSRILLKDKFSDIIMLVWIQTIIVVSCIQVGSWLFWLLLFMTLDFSMSPQLFVFFFNQQWSFLSKICCVFVVTGCFVVSFWADFVEFQAFSNLIQFYCRFRWVFIKVVRSIRFLSSTTADGCISDWSWIEFCS